ncbi:MAG: VWA domain-containing protein [Actinomycetota bacterium]|nr:VWA domain-containing protein [Actinomycetota bacterium]
MAGTENPALMRSGAKTLLQALQGTSSVVSVISFRNNAVTELPPTDVRDQAGYRRAVRAVEGIQFDLGSFGDPAAGTNWEAPLRAARQRASGAGGPPELVVILTDGNPNRYGSPGDRQPSSGSPDFDPRALDAGVVEANALRSGGTRVVAVGVGNVREDSLRAVSGPERGDDWYVGDFAGVAQSVGSVATQLCGTRVLARARIDGVPVPEWTFMLTDAGGSRTERRTGSDGSVFFVTSTAHRGSVTLSSRPTQGEVDLAAIGCTRNDQPFPVATSAVDSGRVMLAPAATDVLACTFDYERDPGAVPVNPELTTSGPAECAKYRNTGAALTPLSTIRLYAQWRKTICEEALRFNVIQRVIAITIQHEGYNRSKLVQGRFDKWLENRFRIRNETVGVGQMRPDLARRLAHEHFDVYDDLSENQIRHKLVYDTPFAIQMTTAYLSELQTTHRLTDREAFIAYAFGAENIAELRRTDFNGRTAKLRGERYDRLAEEITERGEDFS